ncbi:membrane protein-like protein [Parvibaculum lavamentivorans DS-1]|uniref:Membrane protein-like protein n=1 Tax=Parvibaculum lavamentivorans (strain DS-1 / DSM 13023 / NCIMB 13966) TaxID=402881 RepID=A7HWI5_PARL1|nr:DUF2157 domain-containing protein [Parvibaculum lavamentivorans]ABS64268.1 membrane protein-like protein [Parvibaculum lavamentivorans DS-1]
MWQRIYLQRLKHDLDLWIERGWVTPANAESILLSAREPAATRRMPGVLAILGAVLIGFAVMSFVAANWAEISKLAKLIMIFGAMWAAYIAAFLLQKRDHPALAQAAVLIGLGLFGAGIMLIAQIYHIVTDDPAGVLAWCIAALSTAWLLPSRPALALGILLTVVWTYFVVEMPGAVSPHWSFWLPWAAALVLSLRLSWSPGLHLSLIAGLIWQAMNAQAIVETYGIVETQLAIIILLEMLAIWLAAVLLSERGPRFASIAEAYAIAFAFAIFWIFQTAPSDNEIASSAAGPLVTGLMAVVVAGLAFLCIARSKLEARHIIGIGALAVLALLFPVLRSGAGETIPWLYAAAFLVLAAWLVSYGTGRGSRFAVNFGFVAFAAEVLYLYFETLGDLLSTALFFALGGVLLIAGSIVMERMRRRLVKAASEGDAP